ncbi:hypothetical protein DM860_017815 [Cuscuta australis]|uniref:Uncharacterized protein n=1 Tax=Cuscuta australis TaxID=267555 RepID=A0A328DU50_9ASTE|nr:hypothetical protein DM860_017815 [Cuscuta australis]
MPVVGMPAIRTGMVGYFVLAESTLGRCVGPALVPSHSAFGSSIAPTQVEGQGVGANAVGFRLALSGWDGWLRFSSVLHGTHRRDCHGHQAFAGLILAVAVKTCRESLFNLVGSAFVCNGFLCSVPFRWHPYVPTAEFCRVPARVGTKGLAFD